MNTRSLARLAAFLSIVGPVVARAPQPQSGDGPWDAISREITVNVAGSSEAQDAISREITVNAQVEDPGQLDAIGREITVYSPTADLRFVASGTALPSEGLADQVFELRWRVANTGSITAIGPWIDRVTFSVPIRAVGGGTSTVFDFPSSSMLFAGTAYDRVVQFLMPAIPPAPGGTFTISIRTDHTGVVIEDPSEDDNVHPLAGPQVVTVIDIDRPDLGVAITLQPGDVVAGNVAALGFRVCNTGAAATNAQWIDRVYVVPDVDANGIPPASETGFVQSFSFPSLSFLQPGPDCSGSVPGTSYERVETSSLQISSTLVGPFFLAVRADAGGAQIESDEADNLAWSAVFDVSAPPRPDLSPANAGLDGVVPGTPFASGTWQTVEWQVANLGAAAPPAGSYATEIYVSDDADVAGASALEGDLLLASFASPVPQVGPGGSEQRSHQIFVPADLPLALAQLPQLEESRANLLGVDWPSAARRAGFVPETAM